MVPSDWNYGCVIMELRYRKWVTHPCYLQPYLSSSNCQRHPNPQFQENHFLKMKGKQFSKRSHLAWTPGVLAAWVWLTRPRLPPTLAKARLPFAFCNKTNKLLFHTGFSLASYGTVMRGQHRYSQMCPTAVVEEQYPNAGRRYVWERVTLCWISRSIHPHPPFRSAILALPLLGTLPRNSKDDLISGGAVGKLQIWDNTIKTSSSLWLVPQNPWIWYEDTCH